jgi:hypothetical protein
LADRVGKRRRSSIETTKTGKELKGEDKLRLFSSAVRRERESGGARLEHRGGVGIVLFFVFIVLIVTNDRVPLFISFSLP